MTQSLLDSDGLCGLNSFFLPHNLVKIRSQRSALRALVNLFRPVLRSADRLSRVLFNVGAPHLLFLRYRLSLHPLFSLPLVALIISILYLEEPLNALFCGLQFLVLSFL